MGSACALLTELRHFTTTPPALPPSQHCDCVNNVWLLGIRHFLRDPHSDARGRYLPYKLTHVQLRIYSPRLRGHHEKKEEEESRR